MRRRTVVYGVAVALLLTSAVLAAFGVGEEAGKLSDWQAFTLGVVQGLTELLPISSSGHLILVPWLFDWHYLESHEDFNQTFDVALHLGTLVAVVAYFWDDIVRIVAAWARTIRRRAISTADEKIAWLIFAATIPAALAAPSPRVRFRSTSASPGRSRSISPSSQSSSGSPDRSAQTRKLKTSDSWRRSASARRRRSPSCRACPGLGSRSRPAVS